MSKEKSDNETEEIGTFYGKKISEMDKGDLLKVTKFLIGELDRIGKREITPEEELERLLKS